MSKHILNWLIKIENALFYQIATNNKKQYIFSKPIKHFGLSSQENKPAFWGVTGPRKSDFLRILASRYHADPPLARSYPYLMNGRNKRGIKYIDFRDNSGLDKCHMAARYESYSFKGQLELKDDTNSVINFVSGANNYNRNHEPEFEKGFAEKLLSEFDLSHLKNKWVNTLSNGQMRRARIARAIHSKPPLLVIDDPFLGLDPKATMIVSEAIRNLALEFNISIVLGLRTPEKIPDWTTNLAFVDETGLSEIDDSLTGTDHRSNSKFFESPSNEILRKHYDIFEIPPPMPDSAFIEFLNASVIYKSKQVLPNLNWKIKKGSTWRILGDNGSGKTTILSLITAEHPQSWKSFLRINGTIRKPGSGVNYFDINNKIGISSPELHALVPLQLDLRSVILNGLIADVGNSNFNVLYKDKDLPPHVQSILQHFEPELENHDRVSFGELSVSLQKLALFLRALVKNPEILILDEAFSGMEETMVAKCHSFIEQLLVNTTILAIGHLDWEVPAHDYVLKLSGSPKNAYKFYSTTKKEVL